MILFVHTNVVFALFMTFNSYLTISYKTSNVNYTVRNIMFKKGSSLLEEFHYRVLLNLPLSNSTKLLCIFAEQIYILNSFVNSWVYSRCSKVIFDSFPKSSFPPCDTSIVFVTNITDRCLSHVQSFRKSSIYFVTKDKENLNISGLEQCMCRSSSPEVVGLSLDDENFVFMLSSVVPQPRHFRRRTFAQALKIRDHPQKVDLHGSNVTVATMETNIPFFMRMDPNNGSFDGIEALLIRELSIQMNFSPHYSLFGGWGSLRRDGRWVGDSVLQAIQTREADIAMANLWHSWAVYDAMDFGPSMARARLVFVSRRPERIDVYWSIILTLFQPKLWMAVLACYLLVVTAYMTLTKCNNNWPISASWLDASVIILGHMTLCSFHNRDHHGKSRYVLVSWCVFTLLITTSLSTGIVNRITIPYYGARVDTIRELVEGQYYWTVEYYRRRANNTRAKEGMFDLQNPWVNAFEKRYIYLEDDEIHKRTNSEVDKKIVFIVQRYGDDYVVLNTRDLIKQKGLRRFRVVREATRESHNSIGVKKQSPLLKPITILNLRFLQFGLVKHWKDEVLRRWPKYDTSHLLIETDIPAFKEPEELKMDKMKPLFYLFLIGLSIALFVFFFEMLSLLALASR